MTDITIPPEALRAARLAFCNALGDGDDTVKAACLAMLRAWPGIDTGPNIYGRQNAIIHLPLPTENANAEG